MIEKARRSLAAARIEDEAACFVARRADDPHGQGPAYHRAGRSPARPIAFARAEATWDAAEAVAGSAGRLEALFTRRRINAVLERRSAAYAEAAHAGSVLLVDPGRHQQG